MTREVSIKRTDGVAPVQDENGVVLDAEGEWFIEGPPSSVAELAAHLPPGVARHVGGGLLVRFVNVVGILDLPHLGRVTVRSGKWGESDFELMLEDITREMASLPFAAGTGAHLEHDRSLAASEALLYHRFVYLQHILNPASPRDAHLLPAIETVLRDPLRRFRSTRRTSPIESAHRVDGRTLLDLASGRDRWTPASPDAGNGLARRLGGRLPATVNEGHIVPIVDVPENRFVRAFLDTCLAIVNSMERAVEFDRTSVSGWFRGRVLAACARLRHLLAPTRAHRLWNEVGPLDRVPIDSTVLQRARGYRDVLRHYVRLRLAPRVPLRHSVHALLDLKNIAELYELWSFFKVVSLVRELLGPPSAARLRSSKVALFEEQVDRELEVGWAGGITVTYNPAFSRSNAARRSYSVLLRPDVVVSVPDGPHRGLHIFDAKFRLAQMPLNIVDGGATDEDAGARANTFNTADLHKMHTYREAIADARSVRIIYPGTEVEFFTADRLQGGSAVQGIDGVGAIPAVPGSGLEAHEALKFTIRKILSQR